MRLWCETGYHSVQEAGTGQIVDQVADRAQDMLSPSGFLDFASDRPMSAGGVRFLDNAWYFGAGLAGMVVFKYGDDLVLHDALSSREVTQNLGVDQMWRPISIPQDQVHFVGPGPLQDCVTRL